MKWTEISDIGENKRFELLSQELKNSKFQNEFIPTQLPAEYLNPGFFEDEDNCDKFRAFVFSLKKVFDQIRVGGFFRENMELVASEYPAELMQIKILDSLVKTDGHWWPRNQLFHGFIHYVGQDIKKADFSGPILIVGANPESRTIISALIKMGFTTFTITDLDPNASRMLVRDLKRRYFSSKFDLAEMGYVTQLPNIYLIGVNTLDGPLDETCLRALIYFNFLSKGAFWIETSSAQSSPLINEALSFGFQVRLGTEMKANIDYVWAKTVWGHEIDLPRYIESLKTGLV